MGSVLSRAVSFLLRFFSWAVVLWLAPSLAYAQTTPADAGVADHAGFPTGEESAEASQPNSEERPSNPIAPSHVAASTPSTPIDASNERNEEETSDGDPNEVAAEATSPSHGFVFGSYGRVSIASDLEGGLGSDADFVTHGPRIDESTYAEIELRREDSFAETDFKTRIVMTLALAGPLFHVDGDFDATLAVRNLYLEVERPIDTTHTLSAWAGSRMVRGDDIYLLDFWPLDNLNAVGAGVRYGLGSLFDARVHFGLARPSDPFHEELEDVVAPSGFVPAQIEVVDRARLVAATRLTAFPLHSTASLGAKIVGYAELHSISAGERELEDGQLETLPEDSGYVVGAQLGGWYAPARAFVNLFVRYARGLAAYDPLGVPFTIGTVLESDRAEDLVLGLSANGEWEFFGLQLGGYYRRFRDADPNVFERGLFAEGSFVARPHVWFTRWLGVAAELAYQAYEATALDERTGDPVRGTAWKVGFIPFLSPSGRGTYTRPHFRLIYSATIRDEGARALYPEQDPRAQNRIEHFLGAGAEWWFDSSSY